eukprot:91451_1
MNLESLDSLTEEIDVLKSLYDEKNIHVTANNTLMLINVLTNNKMKLTFTFDVTNVGSTINISLTKLNNHEFDGKDIVSSLMNKFKMEMDNMPIYQCIEYFNNDFNCNIEVIEPPPPLTNNNKNQTKIKRCNIESYSNNNKNEKKNKKKNQKKKIRKLPELIFYAIGKNYNTKLVKIKTYNKKFTDILCGDQFDIFFNKHQYYVVGQNRYGQCGVNIHSNKIKLTEMNWYKSKIFHKKKIQIKNVWTNISSSCIFWSSIKNNIYANGKNDSFQIGQEMRNEQHFKILYYPEYIIPLNNKNKFVVDIQCAARYSIALCSLYVNVIIDHWRHRNHQQVIPIDCVNLIQLFYGNICKVYSTKFDYYGGNGHGLQIKNKENVYWKEIISLSNKQIIKVQCGYEHTLFLDINGSVYCCGRNNEGQLGLGHNKNNPTMLPVRIEYFRKNKIKIIDIKCGWYHNLLLDNMGKVYSVGRNNSGQCGHGTSKNVCIPKMIKAFKKYKIIKIKCGAYHSYAMSKNNKHFLWGSNFDNQCIVSVTSRKYSIELPHCINKTVKKETNIKFIQDVYLGCDNTKVLLSNTNPYAEGES